MTVLPSIDPAAETERIKHFITKTFSEAKKQRALVAVSGGVDSATSLLLAAQALGPEHILALHLPSKHSQPINTQHAQAVMDVAKIPPHNRLTIPIGSIIQKTWRIIKHSSTPEEVTPHTSGENSSRRDEPLTTQRIPPEHSPGVASRVESKAIPERQINQLRLANLAARIRMLILFDQAKKHDALVIGTENRSEHLLGYYTRFGDEASDLEPLRHLYKTQVIELAKHLGVPQTIIDKPPSADLWPGQTDAGELGFSYAEADPILYLVEQKQSIDAISAQGFDPTLVKKVLDQIHSSTFKHQVPYCLHSETLGQS